MTRRYSHIETVDGLQSGPWRRQRMEIPTHDTVSPSLWRGLVIGVAIVLPFWLFFGAAVLRWGL